jgi:SAM-dependent methyltransferase
VVDRVRSQVFGEDAETYDAARPVYPAEVVDLVVADGPATAVDVGCGTGKAARLVAARGVDVLGIESDERMADVARRHGIHAVVCRFEDWPAQPHDLVFSGQAWHWIDPERGAAKAAQVLSPGARWFAFWNRERDELLSETETRAYERFAPHLLEDRSTPDFERRMGESVAAGFAAVGGFEPLERHEVAWTDTVDVDTIVARLSTSSAHRLLAPDVAARVHEAMSDHLTGRDRLEIAYTTMVLTARRR